MADNWAVGGFWVTLYLVFSILLQFLEQSLEWRQYLKNCEEQVPAELATLGIEVDSNKFLETQSYQKDKRRFGFVKDWVMFFWGIFSLFYVTPALWHYSAGIFENEYKCTLFWLFLQQWVDKPLSIPFSLYSNFVVEEKHGFNKMTVKLFITDLCKSELLSYFFGGLLIPLLIWIVKSTGESFYLYLWALVQCLIFAFMWIYPNFIQPLFNKFEELKDVDLKQKIEDLAKQHAFPLTKLFQIDGSTRSSHSNAYFFGFWKFKRIVLYDTLLIAKVGLRSQKSKKYVAKKTEGQLQLGDSDQKFDVVYEPTEKDYPNTFTLKGIKMNEDALEGTSDGQLKFVKDTSNGKTFLKTDDGKFVVESDTGVSLQDSPKDGDKLEVDWHVLTHGDILAILCHELGHWKFNHTTCNLVISSAHIFVLFRLFGLVMFGEASRDIIRQFGYADTQAVMVSLMIFTMMFEPMENVLRLLMTMLSRTFEFQADSFAVTNGKSEELASGLKFIQAENKGDLNPDPWYAWYHFSHPHLVERLRVLNKDSKKEK